MGSEMFDNWVEERVVTVDNPRWTRGKVRLDLVRKRNDLHVDLLLLLASLKCIDLLLDENCPDLASDCCRRVDEQVESSEKVERKERVGRMRTVRGTRDRIGL